MGAYTTRSVPRLPRHGTLDLLEAYTEVVRFPTARNRHREGPWRRAGGRAGPVGGLRRPRRPGTRGPEGHPRKATRGGAP
eukprot:2618478-Lingulodinium_polyedra.AAC.1